MFIIWWIIIGLIAGWITGKLMKGSGYGAIMDIVGRNCWSHYWRIYHARFRRDRPGRHDLHDRRRSAGRSDSDFHSSAVYQGTRIGANS